MFAMNKVAVNLVKVLEGKPTGEEFDITGDLNFTALEAVSVCEFDWDDRLIIEQRKNAIKMTKLFVEIVAIAVKQPFQFLLPRNNRTLT